MNKLTLLEEKQIFGKDRLEIFDTYDDLDTSLTDFAILTGAIGYWITSDCTAGIYTHKIHYGKSYGYILYRRAGIRPAITNARSLTENLNINNQINYQEKIEYYEYPQTIVYKELSQKLEKCYQEKTLSETGKTYTTDSTNLENMHDKFKPREHVEYEYLGKKYIRFVGDENNERRRLSDGTIVEIGKPYWIEVQPITWLLDRKSGIALSEKILLGGIQYHHIDINFDGTYQNSNIKNFIDNYLSKDIIPSKTKKEHLIEELKKLSNEINKITEDYNNEIEQVNTTTEELNDTVKKLRRIINIL